MKSKAAPKQVSPLLKPAQKLDERGRFAMSILNRLQAKKPVPAWMVTGAGIRIAKPPTKKRAA